MRKPRFLLRDLAPELRSALEADAETLDQSIMETVRAILCDHYSLNCSVVRGGTRTDLRNGSRTVLLVLQPELFRAIKKDSARSGDSMRSLILNALEAHYTEVVT